VVGPPTGRRRVGVASGVMGRMGGRSIDIQVYIYIYIYIYIQWGCWFCPNWQPFRETLVTNDDVAAELLANPHYDDISIIASQLQTMLRFIKKIHNKAGILDAALLNRCKDAQKYAVETVAFTYVLKHTREVWPGVLVKATCPRAVEGLRKQLLPTHVVFPEQMELVLQSWSDGTMIEQLELEGRQTNARSVAIPSAFIARVPGPAVAKPSPPPPPSSQVDTAPEERKRPLSLAERAKASRRLKSRYSDPANPLS
jgi:hypothetical protein